MKLIIAGSRQLNLKSPNRQLLIREMDRFKKFVTEVVSGGAIGADMFGETWATNNRIPITRFIPDWDKLGKKAGVLRNQEMADYADGLLVFWNGHSKGSADMIARGKVKFPKRVKVVIVEDET
jgi:hypothetical protein